MGNGNCVIIVGDVPHPLFFGRLAVEEFAKRTEDNLSANGFKIATDMVYAGIINFQSRENLPMSSYREVYDLMEEFSDQKDFQEQYLKVDETFFQSKYGSQYKERIEELKKKIVEETEKMKNEMTKEKKKKGETTG